MPGVRSAEVAAVRAALRLPAQQAALALAPVAQRAPKDAVVQFNRGIVLFCAGYLAEAAQAFRAAKTAGRDTYYEMRADEILHPQYFTPQDGLYPVFEQEGNDRLLLQGALLQRQGHQHSAERVYARAARLRPGDDEAQVAAAVARFDEDDLSASFSRLGPLVSGFRAASPCATTSACCSPGRASATEAERQFRQARALGPQTKLGRQANVFLAGLVPSGTNGP